MYICLCNGVTEHQIRACAAEGACTLRELQHCLGVGAGCGRCAQAAKQLLDEHSPNGTRSLVANGLSA
jgi:bacterioferritin-associated ferredoxin